MRVPPCAHPQVAGDHDAITAFQMDIKIEGITLPIMRDALAQAKAGRRHILGEMAKANPPPSQALSTYAPCLMRTQVRASRGRGWQRGPAARGKDPTLYVYLGRKRCKTAPPPPADPCGIHVGIHASRVVGRIVLVLHVCFVMMLFSGRAAAPLAPCSPAD